MRELFTRYGPAPAPEGHEIPRCVVSHPDAGGPCGEGAVGEVWSLPFCEAHWSQARLSVEQELAHDTGRELEAVVAAEKERWPQKKHLIVAVLGAPVPGFDFEPDEVERVRLAAYPPDDTRTDPDTLGFDYEDYGHGPPEWWAEAREYVCRWMREACEAGQPPLLEALEYLRERCTVQEILADRDMERRWAAPRRAAREAERQS